VVVNPEPVNILLVDDQPAKLLSYEVILESLGERLIKAASAREALAHLLKQDVGVVLIDVNMPELDGFELAAMIRGHPRFQQTALIFVSAVHLSEFDRLRGYEAGAVDYVPVPVVPELLRAKVKVFAELHRKTRELERLNAQLEQRVEERTAALEASARELQSLNNELEARIEQRTREREQALAQLFEAQKLDTIGQLTGGVAHDFNNLLMAIMGSLQILRKRLPEDRTCQRLLDNAVQGAERGAALTQRLLAFARRQELRPEVISVGALVDGMSEMLARTLGATISIELDVASPLPPVSIDANQLELALLNLAINARDAMPKGGVLRLGGDSLRRAADRKPAAGRLCPADRRGHRRGHERGDAGPRDRALLHHQRRGEGDRPWAVDGPGSGCSIGGRATSLEPPWRGMLDRGLAPALERCRGSRRSGTQANGGGRRQIGHHPAGGR
jgi:CheY-like chemotaxis protein